MKIKNRISFKEYLKVLFGLTYRKPIMIFLLSLALLLILWIVLFALNIFDLPRPLFYQYLTLGLILIVQPAVIYFTVKKNYQSSNHLRETLEMELTKEEFKVKGESFFLQLIWEKVYKIVEHDNWFLVYQNNLSAILIPKKDLTDEELSEIKDIFNNIRNVPLSLK